MTSIINRSNQITTAEGKPELTRRFPLNKLQDAKHYQRAQRQAQQANGNDPDAVKLTRLEDDLLVRIRDKGYPQLTFSLSARAQQAPRVDSGGGVAP